MTEETATIEGNYRIVYRKSSGKDRPQIGDPDDIRIGDIVTYFYRGWRKAVVDKIWGAQGRRKLKTKPSMYEGRVLRRGMVFALKDIREILRDKDAPPETNVLEFLQG